MSAALSAAEQEHREERALHELPAVDRELRLAFVRLVVAVDEVRDVEEMRSLLQNKILSLLDDLEEMDGASVELWNAFVLSARRYCNARERFLASASEVTF